MALFLRTSFIKTGWGKLNPKGNLGNNGHFGSKHLRDGLEIRVRGRRSDERTVAHWREPEAAATKRRAGALASEKTSNMTALGINTVVYIRTILFQKKILKSG